MMPQIHIAHMTNISIQGYGGVAVATDQILLYCKHYVKYLWLRSNTSTIMKFYCTEISVFFYPYGISGGVFMVASTHPSIL